MKNNKQPKAGLLLQLQGQKADDEKKGMMRKILTLKSAMTLLQEKERFVQQGDTDPCDWKGNESVHINYFFFIVKDIKTL